MNPRNYIVKVFLEHFSFGLIIPISIAWQLSQGLSLVEVGLIQAVVMIATFLLEVPTGLIADKYGRKMSIMSGTLAHTISLILLAFGSNFWMFLLSSVFAGLGWSLISGAGEALVYDSLKLKNLEHTFKKYLSHVMIADESSTLLGMVLSSVIVSVINIQTALGIAAGIMALTLLYGILSLKEVHLKETTAQKKSEEIEKAPEPNFHRISAFLTKHQSYILIMIVFAILYESGRVLWQPRLLEAGLNVEWLGILFACFKVFSIIGSFIAKHVHTNSSSFIFVGSISALTFMLMGQAYLPLVFIGFAIYFLIENVTRVLQSDYLNSIAESRNRATFLSANSFVQNSFSSMFTIGLGVIGETSLMFAFMAITVVKIAAVLILSQYKLKTT